MTMSMDISFAVVRSCPGFLSKLDSYITSLKVWHCLSHWPWNMVFIIFLTGHSLWQCYMHQSQKRKADIPLSISRVKLQILKFLWESPDCYLFAMHKKLGIPLCTYTTVQKFWCFLKKSPSIYLSLLINLMHSFWKKYDFLEWYSV